MGNDDPEETEQFSALVRRALVQLRGEFEPRTWQAFWATAVDELPSADVAGQLGMTANAVRMAKSRVLHRLREDSATLSNNRTGAGHRILESIWAILLAFTPPNYRNCGP